MSSGNAFNLAASNILLFRKILRIRLNKRKNPQNPNHANIKLVDEPFKTLHHNMQEKVLFPPPYCETSVLLKTSRSTIIALNF